jgi:hypothetical protein
VRALRRRDSATPRSHRLPAVALPPRATLRNMSVTTTRRIRGTMHSAPNDFPLSSAIAGGTGLRARGGRTIDRLPGMAQRTALFPSDRGVER